MHIFVHASAIDSDRKDDEMNGKDRVVHPEHPKDPPSTVPSHGGLVLVASIKKEMTA